jgi:hypothetical protein
MHHAINISDTISLYKSIYKLSETELKILKEYLNKNLEKRYIQHFINPAETPILFILKKDENFRLCVITEISTKLQLKIDIHFL